MSLGFGAHCKCEGWRMLCCSDPTVLRDGDEPDIALGQEGSAICKPCTLTLTCLAGIIK